MKTKAIWIDTEIGKEALLMVGAEESAELIPCAIKYLCDGAEPVGKSKEFMTAFRHLLTGAEVANEEA